MSEKREIFSLEIMSETEAAKLSYSTACRPEFNLIQKPFKVTLCHSMEESAPSKNCSKEQIAPRKNCPNAFLGGAYVAMPFWGAYLAKHIGGVLREM